MDIKIGYEYSLKNGKNGSWDNITVIYMQQGNVFCMDRTDPIHQVITLSEEKIQSDYEFKRIDNAVLSKIKKSLAQQHEFTVYYDTHLSEWIKL
jgi:hypothetical protein